MIPHLIQYWLHVLPGQALGSNQALQHPKHAPKATTLFGAEINKQRMFRVQMKEKHEYLVIYL